MKLKHMNFKKSLKYPDHLYMRLHFKNGYSVNVLYYIKQEFKNADFFIEITRNGKTKPLSKWNFNKFTDFLNLQDTEDFLDTLQDAS